MKDRLTASDIKKMEEEIEYRKVTLRHELLEHVKVARAQGDLSENFEYKAAKMEKNKNESRIRYLERMLKNAQVIDDSSKDGEVGINNRVTVEFTDDHSKASYKIVTSVRSNSLKGLISIESPLGKALMGHRVGDVVGVTVDENNSYEVKIKEIEDTTDDAEDEIRKY
ncbi:MAG: transcription elongation factor GreA [Lachnospiraceae bacterium]|nr:transcription elongation factor GreA [Lachnospiraceae bacterium]